MTCRRYESRE